MTMTAQPDTDSAGQTITLEEWSDECDCLHPEAVLKAKQVLGDGSPSDRVAEIFSILADSTRMRIVSALSGSELCVTDLAATTGVNRTTISHQLRVLRGRRLVRRRREGKVVYYALDDEHVMALVNVAAAHVAEGGPDLLERDNP